MKLKDFATTLGTAFAIAFITRVGPLLENGTPMNWKAVLIAGSLAGLSSAWHLYQSNPALQQVKS